MFVKQEDVKIKLQVQVGKTKQNTPNLLKLAWDKMAMLTSLDAVSETQTVIYDVIYYRLNVSS